MAKPPTWIRALFALGAAFASCVQGCSEPGDAGAPRTVVVLAAASLNEAFSDIGAAFERAHPGVKVRFSFAGSNQLRVQLEHGAPGDVFASADRRQMDEAVSAGVIDRASVRVFARNEIAVIVPKANPAGIATIADLARSGVSIVVADDAVPVGHATSMMLDRARSVDGFGDAFVGAFRANIVSREQNVSAVVTKVALGEADAGVAYRTDLVGASANRISEIPSPASLGVGTEDVAGVGARATDPALAREFVEFLATVDAVSILQRHGFTPPESGSP